MFKVEGKKGIEEAQSGQEKKFSDAFSAHGSYSLDLQQCYTPSKQDGARRKRSLDDVMNQNRVLEERLTADFNISKYHKRAITYRYSDNIAIVYIVMCHIHYCDSTECTEEVAGYQRSHSFCYYCSHETK